MAPNLTLHEGEQAQEFTEHPVEVARRALYEAADLEEKSGRNLGASWASVMRRTAASLPIRGPIRKEGE